MDKEDGFKQFIQGIADKHSFGSLLIKALQSQNNDRSLGAMFGAMMGDSLGSYCEFLKSMHQQTLEEAMTMPGGGTFGPSMLPGQYTDDTQLAFHLLSGLNNFDPELQFQESQKLNLLSKIGGQYVDWLDNDPFDIGNTCRAAINVLTKNSKIFNKVGQSKLSLQSLETVKKQIYAHNQTMQSNGSLMRITPMAVFFGLTELNVQEHSDFIINQICLTHPNFVLRSAGKSWVSLLSSLIKRKSDNIEELSHIVSQIQKDNQYRNLKDWFEEAQTQKSQSMKGNPNMGFAKIAWSYGLKSLLQICRKKESINDPELFERWMKWIIGRAGDTDTNACIAGGLIGSLIGFKRLPLKYLRKIFKRSSKNYTNRPKHYQPLNFLSIALNLIQKCQKFKENNQKTITKPHQSKLQPQLHHILEKSHKNKPQSSTQQMIIQEQVKLNKQIEKEHANDGQK